MSNRAWVTLATNDSYGLGALVLAHSLRRVGSTYPAVILITPSVTDAMRDRLRAIFAEVITVDVLDSQDATHLALLQRPELGITFTKIHCWNLTQYDRCVFLDADILVVQNCDELFEREELSAAPDVGWPDCFNSGVFVFQPSADTFSRLITFAQERGSFDGGDQGLLNSFFSSWSTDNNKRLPFLYNVTSAAFYSYLPALKQYGQNLKIIHFIGPAKPWLQNYNFESQSVDAPEHLKGFLQLWWDLFTSQVHTQLDVSMAHFEEPSPEGHFDSETVGEQPHDYFEQRLDQPTYQPTLDSTSEFPWHHPDKQFVEQEQSEQPLDKNEFYDPWDLYSGFILPSKNDPQERGEIINKQIWNDIQHVPQQHVSADAYSHNQFITYAQNNPDTNHYEHNHYQNKHIWDSIPSHLPQENISADAYSHNQFTSYTQNNPDTNQYNHYEHNHNENKHIWDNNISSHVAYEPISVVAHSNNNFISHAQNNSDTNEHNYYEHNDSREHFSDHAPWIDNQTSFDHHDHHNHHEHHDHHYEEDHKDHNIFSIEEPQNNHFKHEHNTYSYNKVEIQKPPAYPINQNKSKHAYCIHMDYEKPCMKRGKHKYNEGINGDVIYVDEIYDDVTPRHPYDGFYLRHRATIDSRGRKICTHQITLRSPSPPPESFEENNNAVESLENGFLSEEEDETGVAGNLARVQPGTPLQREAIDELARRQGWESGNIDYMGADSFANIWAKISQTLNEGPSSPPKQPSPPKESPPVSEEPAKEVAEELAEKVAEATLSDIPDIPVPAREAINAAGKMSDTSSTITIPQIAPDASIAEADTKTETSTAPNETVVAAEICQSLDAIPSETSKGETTLESVASKEDVAETSAIPVSSPVLHEKQPLEPASSETKDAHEVEQMHENDIPKTDSVSEKPVDVHAAEPVAENPIESSPPQLIEAVSVKSPELALESPVAAPQEDIVPTVISDVHESKPSQEASESSKVECAVVAPESKPAPESESIPTVVHESKPAQEPSDASKVACAAEATEAKPTPESESIPSVVHEPKPAQEPSDSSKVECLKKAPESKPASETESIPSVVHESIPTPEADVPKIEAINPIASIPTETPSLEVQEPSVPDADIKKPVAPPSETPKPESISAPSEPKQDKTPVKTDAPASDSPPLANTPSQEEIPSVTAAKSLEEAAQETRL
ncbi:uncharacterized protein LOC123691296 isoform X3 [Colias croceus]|uniref:uncharacterized protein LOC123691296 isoform X3 n=1 Tax=Colias crocea TaxID=72248 RepID=UPI001E27DE93|nr:uncharacterized protein LOC123691296 isoform X3 [Colias croceus]XP_045491600.1 uncharacterized protein LOC123691296 isoform X3 [Colias croceus]